jgi:undecaprenyl diphosphate synthase
MITHLACIMDGNRRWAKKQGWLSTDGHREGVRAAERVVNFCLDNAIPYLSLYTFSTENLKRPAEEQHFLFNVLFQEIYEQWIPQLQAKDVRISFIGDRALFPAKVRTICEQVEQKTSHAKTLHLNFLFCYGGRQEIVAGVKKIIAEVQQGILKPEAVNEQVIQDHLWSAHIPVPEIIIRTGGMARLSNFLLFQAAYSELFFLDCLWPELTQIHLQQVATTFAQRQRNFGV